MNVKQNIIEAVLGAVVLVTAGFFLFFAYVTTHSTKKDGIFLKAHFDRADGLIVGSDVRVSGVKVGVVTAMILDPKTYLADVEFSVAPDIQLPDDTAAAIIGDGLMGAKFLALLPGGSDSFLKPNQIIHYTQSSVNIESLIGQFMFSGKDGAKKEEGPSSKQPLPDSPAPSHD